MNEDSANLTIEKLRERAAADPHSRWAAALAAYEDSRVDGLCHEGGWECALAVLRAGDRRDPGRPRSV